MNSLVSYESSSDEDEASKARPRRAAASDTGHDEGSIMNGTTKDADNVVKHNAVADERLPAVGPMMPEDGHELPEETSPFVPAELSEQDLIRHLTQASHPMTSIPPSPPGSPHPDIETKFRQFLELKRKGLHFNEDLAKKSTFRNPALFEILAAKAGLDEDDQYATSLPASVSDPRSLPPSAYKEELLKCQQNIKEQDAIAKKQAGAEGKRMIDFVAASSRTPNRAVTLESSLQRPRDAD